MTTARELLRETDLLLLDFDGPVTKLLPPPSNAALTDAVRAMALDLGVRLNADEMKTTDHLAIIRAAHRSSKSALIQVEHEATRLEVEAADKSPITPGIAELLRQTNARRGTVVVVTNNSPECVEELLHQHDISPLVETIIGRDPANIDRMKPSPWMPKAALSRYPRTKAIMVGDSVTDVISAAAAGVQTIGLAKNAQRERALLDAGAAYTIRSLTPLLQP